MLKVQNADVYTDFNGLGKLKAEAREQDPEALKQVAKQFESLFLNMVLKSMRQAKLDDGAMDNDQSKFYQDMYDQQLAVHLSGESGIGLANMMVKQLSPNQTQSLAQKDIVEYIKNPTQAINPADLSVHDMAKLGLLKRESTELPPVAPMAAPQLEKLMANLPDIPEPEVPGSKKAFVEQLLPLAQKAAQELGVEPKVLIAQAALETGWGRSVIKNRDGSSSYNLFNIKAGSAWDGRQ
ncbi:MAG: flagellar assembly peptidoglycan hydrolase FlgJ, partial [Methylococcaceae bacterium]|nr:flagellar assembly peptidoglycan hydrolase FlgJ [Methylococcaceae bacterium]